MKKLNLFLVSILALFVVCVMAQPIVRNIVTTNTSPVVMAGQTNAGKGAIAWDVTKQPADALLSNYVTSMKFTGVITNISAIGGTNRMYFTNGILVTNTTGAVP